MAKEDAFLHFFLSGMSAVYVLSKPILKDDGDDATVEQIHKRGKWENDDYVCRGLILNDVSVCHFIQGTVRVHEYVVLALRLQASRDPTWYNAR
ncbi:hypothetical protein Tco_0538198 [Tanacetum coccineum]